MNYFSVSDREKTKTSVMDICFIGYRENNPFIGGIEKVTYLLSKELVVRGHRVTLVSQTNTNSYKKYTPVCEEIFLPDKDNILSERNYIFLSNIIEKREVQIIVNQYSTTRGFCTLCYKIKKQFPQIKIVTPLHLDPLYRLKGNSKSYFIAQRNGKNLKKWGKDLLLFTRFHVFLKRNLLKNIKKEIEYIEYTSDKVILLSKHVKKDIAYIRGNDNLSKYNFINNPIEYKETITCQKKNQALYVGRIEFGLKRLDRVIDIWTAIEKTHKDWNMIVIGDGEHRVLFEKIVLKRGLKHIKFVGFQDPTEYYRESKILCLTSTSEGFANVLVEAQAYGCVPVAFNSYSALNDIIVDGWNGCTAPPFNKKVFINRLIYLMKNDSILQKMQSNAKEHAKKFNVTTITNQWEKLFKELT